jgi:hypothetical protein
MFSMNCRKWPGLAKLAEESGEVLQIIGKIMMIKGETIHWSGNLRTMFLMELADLQAAIFFMTEHFSTEDYYDFNNRVHDKLVRFRQWRIEEQEKEENENQH